MCVKLSLPCRNSIIEAPWNVQIIRRKKVLPMIIYNISKDIKIIYYQNRISIEKRYPPRPKK